MILVILWKQNEYDGRSCPQLHKICTFSCSTCDNVIQFVEIATTGNTQDFGDLVTVEEVMLQLATVMEVYNVTN